MGFKIVLLLSFLRYLHKGSEMFSLSTGEPPTPPSLESDNGQQSRSVPSSLVRTQELDSGYVPSPAAVCDPSGELYFFDRSFVPPTAVSSEESLCCDVFDDVIECVLLHDSNFCSDCGESVPCTCSRTESSATVRASTPRNCVMDSNVCDSDGQSPTARTSSMPIIIPRPHNERQERPSPSNNIVVPPRISFAQLRDLMCSRTHPGGFPSRYIQWLNRVHPSELRSLEEERDAQPRAAEGSRTRNRRNWRRQIDSDFSDSSDDDDNSCSVETEGRSHPVVMSVATAFLFHGLQVEDVRDNGVRGIPLSDNGEATSPYRPWTELMNWSDYLSGLMRFVTVSLRSSL
ncbi:hypothetical protein NPIL_459831 [Nephila pilipes]|uniref:Uncharacterized protein n=1 Tax=Nephila pilipes TaxID=299642 RepID=A0A8X6URC6_NEPPI|nr:hypothetical protein NPIL_459831 [Nephila pilipes]